MVTYRRVVESGPDFYPTPPWGTRALLTYERFEGDIAEPCCGDGAMARVLAETGNRVIASDLHDRGYGSVSDFLTHTELVDNIVTNPPFAIAEDILHHALRLSRRKVCLFLRTAFVESIGRYNRIYARTPPARILFFSKRISLYPVGHTAKPTGGGTTSYAWFVWDSAAIGQPTRASIIAPDAGRD